MYESFHFFDTDKPSAPQGPLQITGVTDTSLTIAWLSPFDNGGIAIEDYCVEIKEMDKKAWKKASTSISIYINIGIKKCLNDRKCIIEK